MANRKKKAATKRTDAEVLLEKFEGGIAEIVGDRFYLLTDALKDLRAVREHEAALRQEIERLMAQSVVHESVRNQLWQALHDLREWHKEEYQSSRRIDAQADAALILLSPAERDRRPN